MGVETGTGSCACHPHASALASFDVSFLFLPSAEPSFRSAPKLFTYSTTSESPNPSSVLWHIKSESVSCGAVTKLGKDFSSKAQVEFVCSAKWAGFGSKLPKIKPPYCKTRKEVQNWVLHHAESWNLTWDGSAFFSPCLE